LVTFSGHRGFHLHLENEDVRNLDQDARRESARYAGLAVGDFWLTILFTALGYFVYARYP
jgi:DNA primase catalytic subunit